MSIPRTTDGLFVSDYVYNGGLANEFAITGFYNEGKRNKAFKVCSDLSLKPAGDYPWVQSTARHNLFYYMPKLTDLAPSFKSQKIDFTPPDGWSALNPSVAIVDGNLSAIVRTVNYRIDEHGAYWVGDKILGDDPIITRNFYLGIGLDPFAKPSPTEILSPTDFPKLWPMVQGFEDMRLFEANGEPWFSATCRQLHWDGNCEQVMGRIEPGVVNEQEVMQVDNLVRMLRVPRQTEKNWAPIDDNEPRGARRFMYRPGHVVDDTGSDVVVHDAGKMTTDIISGGSQVIRFGPGWLALVHTAHVKPGSTKRYYYHRFITYDNDFRMTLLSLPFVLHDKQIEFVAGLAAHPADPNKLVLSYGVDDKEAHIATISRGDVMRMLWQPYK